MVIRLILRYLANNEQLVQRLSESYPIQTAARFAVRWFNRGRAVVEKQELNKTLDVSKLTGLARRFTDNVKKEIQQAKDEINKKK